MKMTFEEFIKILEQENVITYRFGYKDEKLSTATPDYCDRTEEIRAAYTEIMKRLSERV